MTRGVRGLLTKGRVAGKRGDQLILPCPRCGREDTFYVSIEKRSGWCHSGSCHFKINSDRDFYALDLTYRPKKVPGVLAQIPDLYDPAEYEEAREFLEGRNVDPSHPDIRYAPSQRMLYFRITSPLDGFHPSWHRRRIDEKGWIVLKGTDKDSYWYEPIIWHGSRAVLVEGFWDVLAIGEGAVALLGTQFTKAHLGGVLRRGWKEVAIFMDADSAGEKAEREIASLLRGIGVRSRIIRHECPTPSAPPLGPRFVEPSECGCGDVARQARKWLEAGR